ncbi:MAG: glycosyltransferase [Bacteroidota bacterium]
MVFFFLGFTIIHVIFFVVLSFRWKAIESSKPAEFLSEYVPISIIVPFRNESKVIRDLLTSLEAQRYPKDKYEVLLVDDFSEDDTKDLVEEFCKSSESQMRLISLDEPSNSGKKAALTKGVSIAKYDFIVTTDADCVMNQNWLYGYAEAAKDQKFVAGPVALQGDGFFAKLQEMEYAGLMAFGAVSIKHGSPSICSGANLGFDRSAFFEVGGYEENRSIPSGDDEFLLYSIQSRYPTKVRFLKNRSSLVKTCTHKYLSSLLNQRIRWTSKWKYHKNLHLRVTAILFFLDYFIFSVSMILTILGMFPVFYFLLGVAARYFSNLLYLKPLQRFSAQQPAYLVMLALQIIYPFHVLFLGATSIFGRYTWKGRRYTKQ